jgi:hypothetical protein
MPDLIKKLSNLPNLMYAIVGAVIVLGSIAGGAFFMEDRYANAEQTVKSMIMLQQSVEKTNVKIDMHAMQQRIDALQQQIWKMEDRYNTTDPMAMPTDDRARYRALQKAKADVEYQLRTAEANLAPSAPSAPSTPRTIDGGN